MKQPSRRPAKRSSRSNRRRRRELNASISTAASLSPGCIPDKTSRWGWGLNNFRSEADSDALHNENCPSEHGIMESAIYEDLIFGLSECKENRLTSPPLSTTFAANPVVIRRVATNLKP